MTLRTRQDGETPTILDNLYNTGGEGGWETRNEKLRLHNGIWQR